jgi:hypothetical protein
MQQNVDRVNNWTQIERQLNVELPVIRDLKIQMAMQKA